VLCPTDAHWHRLCELMNDPATEGSRLADMKGRCAHMDEVDAIVTRWTRTRSKDDLARTLKTANIPCAPVVTLPELLDDPHVRERGVLREVADEQGTFTTLGSPLLLSDSPMVEPARSGALGEHTDEVLAGDLGMSADEIAKLRDANVI
jgi:formyl-CoA transferase